MSGILTLTGDWEREMEREIERERERERREEGGRD